MHVAELLGVSAWIPQVVLVPVTAAAVWPIAYFIFNKWVWSLSPLAAYFGIPNLRGDWQVEGETLGGSNYQGPWKGTLTIHQNWDKLKVSLRTANSGSDSIMAATVCDPTRGFVLMYTYGNTPRLGQKVDMHSHVGYCQITFDKELKIGDAEYFNNRGRTSFGRMKLTRRIKYHAT